MFDVNSLGGKLIDNQNLKKALESSGGSSGGTIIDGTVSGELYTIQKPFSEINDEFENGGVIYVNFPTYTDGYGNTRNDNKRCLVIGTNTNGTHGYVYVAMSMNDAIIPMTFHAETSNDNPSLNND